MLASDWVVAAHWVIYLVSIAAFLALPFSRVRRIAALWIAGLFVIQAIFHGCPMIDLQDHFLASEGMPLIREPMLTAVFAPDTGVQSVLSWLMAGAALIVAALG